MKKTYGKRISALLCALLLLFLTGCASVPADPSSTPMPTAPPDAHSVIYPEEIYPEEEPSASPTAEPTPEPTAEPTAEPTPASAEITAEIAAMYPLLEAHILTGLTGGVFDAADPVYYWRTISFAMDACGMDFYTAETMGSALVLSRGVIEEMASGLFEGAGEALLEIPDALSDVIWYDQAADAFSCPLGEGNFRIEPENLTVSEGVLTLHGAFFAGDDPEPVVRFTAELVPNTRSGNSLFLYAVRSITLTA